MPRTATAARVDRDQLIAFLRARTRAVLLTRRACYRAISGVHPDCDGYRAAMSRQGRSLLRITVTGWGPVATGGFPPGAIGKL